MALPGSVSAALPSRYRSLGAARPLPGSALYRRRFPGPLGIPPVAARARRVPASESGSPAKAGFPPVSTGMTAVRGIAMIFAVVFRRRMLLGALMSAWSAKPQWIQRKHAWL